MGAGALGADFLAAAALAQPMTQLCEFETSIVRLSWRRSYQAEEYRVSSFTATMPRSSASPKEETCLKDTSQSRSFGGPPIQKLQAMTGAELVAAHKETYAL
jgi:hypothetical protein